VPAWDPENSTLAFALTVDGAGGRFVVDAATGAVTVAPAANGTAVALNFEALPNVFRLSVTAVQRNDSTMLATNSFVVQLTDANDPPLIKRGQALQLWEYADAAASGGVGVNSVLAGIVAATDEDTNSSFNSGSPTFSLVTSGCPGVDAANATLAASLFSIGAASGAVTLTANPPAAWRLTTAFAASGQLVRAAYSLCVRTVDVAGASDLQPVQVLVLADVPAQPVISSASLGAELPTTGGTVITFVGYGFRPGGSTPSVAATYSNGALTFTATGCAVLTDASFTCVTAPGWSSGFDWSVTFNGAAATATTPLTMSYAPPTVTAVSASRADMPTVGGTLVTFTGDNFGPPAAAPTLFVGNNGREFDCVVTTFSHTSLTCSMPAGVGSSLAWTLSVGAQATDCPLATCATLLNYAAPNITGVLGGAGAGGPVNTSRLDTVGGQAIVILGTNFGPSSIVWRQDGSTHATLSDPLYGVVAKYGGAAGNLLAFAGCTQAAGSAHTQLTCSTVSGVGAQHRVSLTVGGQPANQAPAGAFVPIFVWPPAAGLDGLSYLPPELLSVAPSAGFVTNGGSLFVVTGRYFGPPGTVPDFVSYGKAANPSYYSAASCAVTTQTPSSSTLTCATAPGVGAGLALSLSIGLQRASVAGAPLTLTYAPPQIFKFSGAGAANANTLGNEDVFIDGANFGPQDAYTSALVASSYGVALRQGGASFLAAIPAVSYVGANCTIEVPHVQLRCRTAVGAGRALAWSVVVDAQPSASPTTAYNAPVVNSISLFPSGLPVLAANVNGGDIVLLNGQYFGPPLYPNRTRSLVQSVSFGAVGTERVVTGFTVFSDSTIRVVLPPGSGTALRFVVTVADQQSAPSAGTFSYALPSIVAVSPASAPTFSNPTQPTLVTIRARNLPLLDTLSFFSLTLGQGAGAVTRTLSLPAPADIAAKTNADGSVNATFTLPTDGAGWGLGVSVSVFSGSATSLAAETNATKGASLANDAHARAALGLEQLLPHAQQHAAAPKRCAPGGRGTRA
jgi:hypothetical protein